MNSENHHVTQNTADTFDVMGSLRTIAEASRNHRLLAISTCLLTLGLAITYYVVWPPVYRAEATLMAERATDEARDTFYINWNVFRKEDARTEVELMTSASVLKAVIKAEQLTYEDVYHPPLSHLAYLWGESTVGKWYRSVKGKIFPPQGDAPTPEEIELARTLHDMASGISIVPVGETNIGRLTVKGPSRRVAQIANTLMDTYLTSRIQRHRDEAQDALTVLNDQADRAQRELRQLEVQRVTYAQENGLIFDLQRESLKIAQLTEVEGDLSDNRRKIAVLEAVLAEVNAQLLTEPEVKTASTVYDLNSQRETIKLKRLELQTTLIQLRDRYRPDSPEVQEIEGNIAELDAMAGQASERVERTKTETLNLARQELVSKRNMVRSELAGAQAGIKILQERAAELGTRLAAVPEMRDKLRNLDRDAAVAQQKYQELLLKQAQAEVSLATSGLVTPSMRVVDYAVPPPKKSAPRAKLFFPAALLLGLFLGVVAAQIKVLIVGRVRREHVVGGRGVVPLYGSITVRSAGPMLTVGQSETAAESVEVNPSS